MPKSKRLNCKKMIVEIQTLEKDVVIRVVLFSTKSAFNYFV
jgi:hypothetical protein